MNFAHYKPTEKSIWTGRIDDLKNRNSFRIHQIVNCFDLRTIDDLSIATEKINICLIGYCSDAGITRNLGRSGAKNGPKDIRKELANLPVTFGMELTLYDAGNIHSHNCQMEDAQQQLSDAISTILSYGMFPIVLGGGHELAFGHFNGLTKYLEKLNKNHKDIGIINFDAHFDLRPAHAKGSSGTMFSQIAESYLSEGENFNYMCLGIQTSGNTVSLFQKANKLGVKYILAKDFTEHNHSLISQSIKRFIHDHEYIYLTLCTDVFNSAFAPGVSSMQPFGMNPETGLLFIKEILSTGKTISFDIAEVSPRFDHDKRTAKLAAVIIYAAINTLLENSEEILESRW